MPVIDPNFLADGIANKLFTSLTADSTVPPTVDLSDPLYTFTVDPTSDLYSNITPVSLDQLTTVDLAGTGVFDKLMASVDLHIQREFKGNRITGDQYAKVYTEVMGGVLNQSTQFLLQKDQAKWSAIAAQMQARIAEIQATEALINLERARVETQKAIFDMQNSGAVYALTKMSIASTEAQYQLIKAQADSEEYKHNFLLPTELSIQNYKLNSLMPMELAASTVNAQRILPAEASIKEFQNQTLQPIEEGIQNFQLLQTLPLQQLTAQYGYDNLLPVQFGKEQYLLNTQMPAQTALLTEQMEVQRSQTVDNRSDNLTPIAGLVGKQRNLLQEQIEGERSKTMDTRTDGSTIIEGSVGKQKDLYDQQIDSFIKDSKQKAAKMYLDGWITQKTLDENLAAPTELEVPSVSAVLLALRTENGLT